MALGLIGKKVGMTQVFDENGLVVPVTVIEAGPCVVVQCKTSQVSDRIRRVKTRDGKTVEVKVRKSEGYDAVKLGYQEKTKNVSRPEAGQYKNGIKPQKIVKEFRLDNGDNPPNVGDTLTVELFQGGDFVDVSGTSKGRGFQGTMRRHGFGGGPKTHGSKFKRAPGSIGQCAWPAKVFKGKRMAGQMGNERVTMQNLRVVSVDPESNVLLVKGSVPGARETILYIRKSVKKRTAT